MGTDELARYLDALEREDCYRVDAVLKESAYEVTQRVSFIGTNGAEGAHRIRKYIKRESGLGAAYERLHAAQESGKRFRHLPIVYECYATGENLVVVMELAPGETLADYVYRHDPSPDLARSVFPLLCDAVSELHEEFDPPIVHRDLKPTNVIVSDGGLTLIDLGIAREYRPDADEDTTHFGTRSFAPPEQFGYGQTTVRTDVYALGMLLYYCLTETIPDSSAREKWFLDERIPLSLRGVIAKAAAFDPNARYASARELKEAFLAAGSEGPAHQALSPDAPASDVRPSGAIGGSAPDVRQSGTFGDPAPGAPRAYDPYPTATRESSAPPVQERPRAGGASRGFATAIAIIMCASSWYNVVNPPQSVAAYPPWFNVVTFGIVVPVIFLIGCFIVHDHYRAKPILPGLAKFSAWICAFVFVAIAFVAYVFVAAALISFSR